MMPLRELKFMFVFFSHLFQAPIRPPTTPCKDISISCKAFKKYNYCKRYLKSMMVNCKKTCGLCGKTPGEITLLRRSVYY